MATWREVEARIASGGTITLDELDLVIAKGSSRTADESERLFQACPEWVAEHEAREAQRRLREEEGRIEEALLLADLRRVGYRLESVWDFVNTADSYPEAIPVLLDHLRRPYSDIHREGMARALSVREARGIAGPAIVAMLREEGLGAQLRWALANALTIVADRTNRDDIKMLIEAEVLDDVRTRLVRALKTASKS